MKYVLDSSVAAKWFLPEADSDKAVRFRDDFRANVCELLSPAFFPVEVCHTLTRAERQGRISVGEAVRMLADLMRTMPDLHQTLALLPRATAISSAARIGVYDCTYVALAEREQCDLVTADEKLLKTLGSQFPFIKSLSSFP
jgi:predicted nucleic acid-binding protein